MKKFNTQLTPILYFIPFVGIAIFIALYCYATTLYPGGSQSDLTSEGFSWLHNYWCNLLNEKGMNGELNQARPYAITAMFFLCISLSVFFIQFAKFYANSKTWRLLIQVNGICSMLFALLIFTSYHDLMTTLSSIFGIIVVIGIIKGVYSSKQSIYQKSGLLCMLLLGMNNFIYYTEYYLVILPLLQKLTFAFVLLWIIALNTTLK